MHEVCTFCKKLALLSLYSIQFFIFISYSVYIILTFLVKTLESMYICLNGSAIHQCAHVVNVSRNQCIVIMYNQGETIEFE